MTDEDYDADRQISWPDLTVYGLMLEHCIFPSGKRMLAIRPRTSASEAIHEIMRPFEDRLRGVGFVAHPSGVWLGSGTDITTIPWRRHFPDVAFEMRTLGEMTEDMREPPQPGPRHFGVLDQLGRSRNPGPMACIPRANSLKHQPSRRLPTRQIATNVDGDRDDWIDASVYASLADAESTPSSREEQDYLCSDFLRSR